MLINELIEKEEGNIENIKGIISEMDKVCKKYDGKLRMLDNKKRGCVKRIFLGAIESDISIQAYKKIIDVLNHLKNESYDVLEDLSYCFRRNKENVFLALAWEGNSGSYFEGSFPILGQITNIGEVLTCDTVEDAHNKLDEKIKIAEKQYHSKLEYGSKQ